MWDSRSGMRRLFRGEDLPIWRVRLPQRSGVLQQCLCQHRHEQLQLRQLWKCLSEWNDMFERKLHLFGRTDLVFRRLLRPHQ